MLKQNKHRRSFIKRSAAALIALPSLGALKLATAEATNTLSEDDPMANALGYKANTADVNGDDYPNHTASQICVDCILYQGDDPEWGGCSAFPGKLVAGQGWCAAYVSKPA